MRSNIHRKHVHKSTLNFIDHFIVSHANSVVSIVTIAIAASIAVVCFYLKFTTQMLQQRNSIRIYSIKRKQSHAKRKIEQFYSADIFFTNELNLQTV